MGGCLSRKTGTFDPQKDLNDLAGKVAIVTGAKCVTFTLISSLLRILTSCNAPTSTGIGYHTVKFLARKGAKVYLGARNKSKAMAAICQLEEEGIGPGEVVWLPINLSDPQWAKKAAEEFLEKESRLDILSRFRTTLYWNLSDEFQLITLLSRFYTA